MKSHDRKKIKWNKNGIDAKKMNSAAIEIEKEGEFHWLNAHHWSVWLGKFYRLFCHWFMCVFKRSRVNIHISNFEWNKISVFHCICAYHLIFSLFSGIESSEYPESKKKETEEENETEGVKETEWKGRKWREKYETEWFKNANSIAIHFETDKQTNKQKHGWTEKRKMRCTDKKTTEALLIQNSIISAAFAQRDNTQNYLQHDCEK